MNWFVEVLKKYAVFSGRARRKEYWMFALFASIIYVVLAAIGFTVLDSLVPALVFYVAVLLPALGVTVRRLHDTGRTGWWILIGVVPLVGEIVMLVFLCGDSEAGENQYGPNPKAIPAHA
ncbi:DUF805 domain-containing protein [Streptomyces acidicola]|uniref:DUF805 domain-containing protein n=1 Tax=Streptomyces acidicola TaxID=2596892 RepID=UPI0037ABB6AF